MKNFRAAENPQIRKNALESLQRNALEALGAEAVEELVEDIPGWPWFAAAIGDLELTVSYYPTDDAFVVSTFEDHTLLHTQAGNGTGAVLETLLRLRDAQALPHSTGGV
ncbi:hypothetical protein [Burkholderia oklahomensis]|uniref:hypothetical protein n=1 Tax=Burkholderia oklahomensis TaxID=342113 RepID=UPI0011982549|nr:hypothetical protein [Burkholderia oklahomensis]QPS39554.1 hypothetical protein I6G57_27340 [Burkholderia oklahomensis]